MIPQVRRGGGFVALLLLLALVGAPPVMAQDYTIGGRDILRVTVLGQVDLSKDYPVSEDGVVQVPFIGAVQAAGLTTTQLAARLAQLLEKDYLVDPQVLVAIAEYRSQKVTVLGEVEKAGLYYLTGPDTVLDVLSRAGGFVKTAGNQTAGNQIVLIRKAPKGVGGDTILRLSLEKVQAGDRSENVALRDEDTIYIPKAQDISFFVVGEVTKPGAYQLVKETNVLEAIAVAGGFTNKAAPGRTRVIRRTATGTEDIAVDMADIMRRGNRDKAIRIFENDVIVVPESFF